MTEKGQTLIEALVALGAAVIVLSAITVAVISALNNVQYTKNQNQATQYAQQGVEIMRQISQSNWEYFSSQNKKSYCLPDGNTSLVDPPSVNGCGQNIGIFVREVDIVQNSNSCSSGSGNALITVTVSWSDSKCDSSDPYCHDVKLNSCLSNHNTGVSSP
jgi:type II secretory pathway pseudopilin PulG